MKIIFKIIKMIIIIINKIKVVAPKKYHIIKILIKIINEIKQKKKIKISTLLRKKQQPKIIINKQIV